MLIWLLADPDSSKHLAFREMLEEFCAHFPEARAEFAVKTRRSLWESVFSHLRDSKRNPLADVIEIPHNWTALFAKLGLLYDFSRISDDFNPLACPGFVAREYASGEGGSVFSAPWWMEGPALFYDQRAVKAWGGPPADKNLSWEEFVSALEKLSSGKGFRGRGRSGGRASIAASRSSGSYPLCFSSPAGSIGLDNVLPRVWSRGGGLFSQDLNRASFNKDETMSGVRDMLGLAVNGYARLFSPSRFEGAGCLDEHSAFIFSPRDLCSGKDAKGGTLEMLPFPGCGQLFPVNISSLAIFSGTSSLRQGVSLLKWLLKPERSVSLSAAFSVFPCNKTAFEERLEGSRQEALYRRIFAGADLKPNVTVYPTAEILFERILWNMSLAIARGDYSVEGLTREMIIAQGEADYLLSLY